MPAIPKAIKELQEFKNCSSTLETGSLVRNTTLFRKSRDTIFGADTGGTLLVPCKPLRWEHCRTSTGG